MQPRLFLLATLIVALGFGARPTRSAEPPTRFTNLSVRSFSGAGDRVLILGFTLDGGSKPLVVRAVGPSLAAFGVTGFVPDPRLSLYAGAATTPMLANDNWSGDDGHLFGAFALPAGSKDAVIKSTFQSGTYSAQADAADGSTGNAIVEVYDADLATTDTRLINVSTRTQLDDGQRLIVGFTLTGSAAKGIVLRAVGPGLAAFGLSTAHPDPRMELYDAGGTIIATNDNWSGDNGASSGAFGLPRGSKDAVIVQTLAAGSYTVHVLGAAGANGLVLVEGYEAKPPTDLANLTAAPGNAQVSLSWTASAGAASYQIKRATTSGGPYATVATTTSNGFTDVGLTNGDTYYYVVSAENSIGETPNTREVSAKPDASIAPVLVYSVENTGANYPAPPLPTVSNAMAIPAFPDPFAWGGDPTNLNGTRSTSFGDWEHHRNEVRAYIENYEIGTKPVVSASQVSATYANGNLTVNVTVDGKTLTLVSPVAIPDGAVAPYPVCIGMNSAYGSLGSAPFTTRGIASVVYRHNQTTTYGNPQSSDPFYQLYPQLWGNTNTGQYSPWAWGVSRLIDGLVIVKNAGALNVDLEHICVTGCSYAGKMALYSGALDERIALTIAQESGGGGDTSWRYSATEPSGTVEHIDNTDYRWFKTALREFGSGNQKYLPFDQHMLMAMCAPRALYCTANTDYTWLSNPSAYVAGQATAKTYAALGIADRFGFNVDGGHSHCSFPGDQAADLAYFLDKFMKGQTNLSQTIRVAPASYSGIDYARWTAWWGTTNPAPP